MKAINREKTLITSRQAGVMSFFIKIFRESTLFSNNDKRFEYALPILKI